MKNRFKERGCIEKIFIFFTSNLSLSQHNRKTYAFFMDFLEAFDSVNMSRLNLSQIEVSAKFIRKICPSLYDRAKMWDLTVRTREGLSYPVNALKGAFKREILSPLLFYTDDSLQEGYMLSITASDTLVRT